MAPFPLVGITPIRNATDPEIRVSAGEGIDVVPFRREDMGFVGVYDVDLLLRPEFGQMLDIFAATPGAISGVRFFGIFTAGQSDQFKPDGGGTVWTNPDAPIDFTIPMAALEKLTSRGLTPFISLGFFPPAISPSPIAPPSDWSRWKRLVVEFLTTLAVDPRFGEALLRDWWFEVWNEPNEGRFWSGTREDYFALYRATSEAVAESGVPIRLGGPAIAYKPQASPEDGAPWMERFLQFIASDPSLQCDFVSFHRKGTVGDDPPDPRRLLDAAREVRDLMTGIDPERFVATPIINNEADEKVGFEVPYAPRMTHVNTSWLAAVASIQAVLSAEGGRRFMAAADNANLQLVQEPFDGRRSLLTRISDTSDELVKLPAFGFYELIKLLEGRQGQVRTGATHLFPATDLHHLTVISEGQIGSLLTWYPAPDSSDVAPRTLAITIEKIPWSEINVAVFCIDQEHSNAWTAAGGTDSNPYPKPDPGQFPVIRSAQEIALDRPVQHRVATVDGTWTQHLTFAPYTTLFVWITPWSDLVPVPPANVRVTRLADRTRIDWPPAVDPSFYRYEVRRIDDAGQRTRISPDSLRSAQWTDDLTPPATRYAVRTISTSGLASPFTES